MTDLGRCTHRTRWHDGDPPNMRARSTCCTAPAEWICGDGGPRCDTHDAHGIYGGLTATERVRRRRWLAHARTWTPACPACGHRHHPEEN